MLIERRLGCERRGRDKIIQRKAPSEKINPLTPNPTPKNMTQSMYNLSVPLSSACCTGDNGNKVKVANLLGMLFSFRVHDSFSTCENELCEQSNVIFLSKVVFIVNTSTLKHTIKLHTLNANSQHIYTYQSRKSFCILNTSMSEGAKGSILPTRNSSSSNVVKPS